MHAAKTLQNWVAQLDRRLYAILIGLTLGIGGGALGLMLVLLGPLLTLAAVGGALAGLYVLTDIRAALYGVVAVVILVPFGTIPVDIGVTPTLLDAAMAAFLLVYLIQWMTGQRRRLQLTPAHVLITLYLMWLIFAFMMGLRYGMPNATTIRQFAETLLSIGMVYILVDVLHDPRELRRLVLVVMLLVGVQAVTAIGLWLLPDSAANTLLNALRRIGYPTGNVIRYIEANPELPERAIGTWIDPNSLGGILATGAAMIAPQVFARRPVLRWRWLTVAVLGATTLALLLTSSRASFLALGAGLSVIAVVRYRRFIPLLMLAGALMLLLPQTQNYIDRIFQAFRGEDLATQMRIGEWTDSLELIQQYPVMGIGFTGTPTIDLYTDVANMYLIMANQIGLMGVVVFLVAMSGVFVYGWGAWRVARTHPDLDSIHLGYHVALLTALVNAVADLYFFRLDFHASITWFWLIVALALATSRLVYQHMRDPATDPVQTAA